MSSRSSPNFPKLRSKPTQEIESGFFRNWSLRPSARLSRSSDTGQSSDVSPGTSPTPLAVSVGGEKAQRKAVRPEHHRLRSEPLLKSVISQGAVHDGPPPTTPATRAVEKKPSLLAKASTESLASDSRKSRSSPGSSTFRRLVYFSSQCLTQNTRPEASPPLKAKDDIRWKHEISGRSVEIRIARQPHVEELPQKAEDTAPMSLGLNQSAQVSVPTSPDMLLSPLVGHCDAPPKSLAKPVSREPLAVVKQASTKSAPATPEPKAGKFLLKRHLFGRKQATENRPRPAFSQARSMTGHVLERAASILKDFVEKTASPISGASSSSSNTSIAASYSHNLQHQRPTPLYKGYSNASSVGNMAASKAPVGTPASTDSRLMYTGSDDKQYFRVEISEPGAPTYLPSEARRIGTPPLPGQNSRVRGFFFDYNVLDDGTRTPSPEKVEILPPQPRIKRKKTLDPDWYGAKLTADEERDLIANFELNVPDHLPGSPLCPKHPKHKSGGRGICVYHGRNRESQAEN
ncbi:MAG: hypothetical protein Q9191_004898 [Dirinaria sp. TL-2023a]